jgi:hypothetical protein
MAAIGESFCESRLTRSYQAKVCLTRVNRAVHRFCHVSLIWLSRSLPLSLQLIAPMTPWPGSRLS